MSELKLAIIHYLPLEYYPPVCNMIDFLSHKDIKLYIFSCGNPKQFDEYKNDKVEIFRHFYLRKKDFFIFKALKHLLFAVGSLLRLIRLHPDLILYYEPHSAWTAYFYCRYLNPKARLFIHYHEYYSPANFLNRGMAWARLNHHFEKKYLYKKSEWISQTNIDRKKIFLKDCPQIEESKVRIAPNYPPRRWWDGEERKDCTDSPFAKPYRCVYLGALSFRDTYIKEFCEWVIALNGKIKFDVFSAKLDDDTQKYLEDMKSPHITYTSEHLNYHRLPGRLRQYDIGLVLYKCNTLNFVYNMPNKIFEYLSCGLDVWFPKEMKGSYGLINEKSFPKILCLDFMDLKRYDIGALVSREGLVRRAERFISEDVYEEFYRFISGGD